MRALSVFLVLLGVLLGGCASVDDGVSLGMSDVSENPLARLAVEAAVVRFVDSADVPAERAARVVAVVSEARGFVGDDSIAWVAAMETGVEMAIDWDRLSARDAVLVRGVIRVVGDEIRRRMDCMDGMDCVDLMDGTDVLAVGAVLDWVIGVAVAYLE